ncbi:MAG TPA: transcriptional repressor [Chthonomonadales bacterium]|nr:transcriptional repressor [Chthonomonadales bacterium]
MRVTRQREAVLEALCELRCHPTAEEVHARVRQRLPHVSLGTVYRILASLVADGTAASLSLIDGPRRYDLPGEVHHHLVCSRCGAIDDVPDVVAAEARDAVERATGYAVESLRLKWVGVCPTCRAAGSAPTRPPHGEASH